MADYQECLARAESCSHLGQHQLALEAYREAQQLDPQSPEPVYGEAMMLIELERFAEARERLRNVLQLDPAHDQAVGWLRRLDRMHASREAQPEPELLGEIPDLEADLAAAPAAPAPAAKTRAQLLPADNLSAQDTEDPFSQNNLEQSRTRRKLRKLKGYLLKAALVLVLLLGAYIALTVSGKVRAGKAEVRPKLPETAPGAVNYTGVYHCLVPGVFLRLEQEGARAKVWIDVTSRGPAEAAPVSGEFSGASMHCGVFWLTMRNGGWDADINLGRVMMPLGLERIRTVEEVYGWEALRNGNVASARSYFLSARGAVLAAPGPLTGLIAADYADGLYRKVQDAAREALTQQNVLKTALTQNYLLHLASSATARLRAGDQGNAMDDIEAALGSLPQEGIVPSPILQRVMTGETALIPSLHETEIRRIEELCRPALHGLKPLRHHVFSYLPEDLAAGRLQRAWDRYLSLRQADTVSQAGYFTSRLAMMRGDTKGAREALEEIALLGARMLQAGLEGEAPLRNAVDGIRNLLRPTTGLSLEEGRETLSFLSTLRRECPHESVHDAQQGNLVALLGQTQAQQEQGYEIRQRIALVDLDLTLLAAAMRVTEIETGAMPDGIDRIDRKYLPGGILDPFDGQPLRVQLVPGAAVLWSVGPDGTDDKGETPIGSNRVNPLGGDIIVRIPTAR